MKATAALFGGVAVAETQSLRLAVE